MGFSEKLRWRLTEVSDLRFDRRTVRRVRDRVQIHRTFVRQVVEDVHCPCCFRS